MTPLTLGLILAFAAADTAPARTLTTRPIREPTTRPDKGFTITGVLAPPDRVKRVRLIDREDPANALTEQRKVYTAAFDAKTGRFTAQGLAKGYYDLMIDTPAGPIDGVNLRDTPDPFDLAPKTAERPPLEDEDLKWIDNYLNTMKTFENRKRYLAVSGNGERAKALVELIRDEATTLSSGEAIWRIEVWDFQKLYGAWRRKAWYTAYRKRMPIREFRLLNWMFDPSLGGLPAAAGYTTDLGEYAIPDKFDPARGRTPA